jgi:uncharacterized protein (UPF0332 family)
MTWPTGQEQIRKLITEGELEQVTADQSIAQRLLDDASRHLATATAALASEDLSGAYQLAYHALRKSAAALLATQGLRATSRGGHVAVQDTVLAQFGSTVKVLRSFSRIRRGRNRFEYPDTDSSKPTTEDVQDAIHVAAETHGAAVKILAQHILTPW